MRLGTFLYVVRSLFDLAYASRRIATTETLPSVGDVVRVGGDSGIVWAVGYGGFWFRSHRGDDVARLGLGEVIATATDETRRKAAAYARAAECD